MLLCLLHGASRGFVPLGATLALTLLPSCRPAAAPAPVAASAPATVVVAAPPQAEPRCEELVEACAANKETVLSVPSSLRFTPPLGWHYATQPAQAVARSADGKALLAFAASSGDLQRRDDRTKILTRLEALVQGLGVSEVDFARLEKRLREPDTNIEEEGSFPISLWEVGADHQDGKSPLLSGSTQGTVLIVVSTTPVGLLLLGAAFVTPDVAADQAPRVMDSVKSLSLMPTAPLAPTPAKSDVIPAAVPTTRPSASAGGAERPL